MRLGTNKVLYGAHRWIALVALAQLAVWSVSGFVFSVLPITRVRSEDTTAEHAPSALAWSRVRPLPEPERAGVSEVLLRSFEGRPTYEVLRIGGERSLVDAETGAPVVVDEQVASRIAQRDQLGAPAVARVVRIEEAPIEYRERPVPAWRVELADGRGTRIYVDATTGAVTARRNDAWRVYDLLWSLHIMDYRGRDDFNNLLLTTFAGLGVATALSGTVLWWLRAKRRLRRRNGVAVGAPAARPARDPT